MSRATCVVRFPDGELRVGIYDATRSLVRSNLYTVGQWEAWWREHACWPAFAFPLATPATLRAVHLAHNTLGDCTTWEGFASKLAVFGASRDPDAGHSEPGLPTWWPWAMEDGDEFVAPSKALPAALTRAQAASSAATSFAPGESG